MHLKGNEIMNKLAVVLCLILSLCLSAASAEGAQPVDHSVDGTRAIRIAPEEEHYIFELDEQVTRTHVYPWDQALRGHHR